jgi:hypothetical protein
VSATVDLAPATAANKRINKDLSEVESATPAGRFVAVSEEEHRRHEAQAIEPGGWRGLQTTLLAATAVLLAVSVWYLTRPPTADRLYNRISQAAETPEKARLQSAKADVSAFLSHYPDDPRAAAVQQAGETIELYWLGRRAEQRARSTSGVDSAPAVERAYLEAMNFAKLTPDLAYQRLVAIIDLYGGDASLPAADQEWLKLARKRAESLKNQARENAQKDSRLLAERLDAADQLEQTDPAAARAIREAIVKLYADKPWAAPVVERAQAALAARTAADERPGS